MLFKLAVKNIQKSFKDYAIYFFTLILGVAIFYVFNAIESQTVLMDVTSQTYELIKLLTSMLSGVSVFVSFILGFLIIYASRFLIKRRNKEFGIYLTLGMSKRKISMILFVETLLIGIVSLAVGLGVGVVLSQFMSILVVNMFDADMTRFQFVFSSSACIKTLIYFGIMYLMVMLFNTVNIGRCKLIDLLSSHKRAEKIKLKNPIVCTIIFILACCTLGCAYYLVMDGLQHLQNADQILIPIAMGIVSTFFIFWSLSGLLLKVFMSMKRFYYKGLNSFTLRQFSSKINTTAFSMTIICLMLFITICVLSSCLSIKNSLTANIKKLAPVDLQLTKRTLMDESWVEDGYSEKQVENASLSVEDTLKVFQIDLDRYLKEKVEFHVYHTPDLTLKDSLGTRFDEVQKLYRFLNYDNEEDIIKISDYNRVATLYGLETYSLKKDEYMIIADFDSMVAVRNIGLKNKEELTIYDHTLKPKYTECKDGFVEISSNHINSGIILVPDEVVENQVPSFDAVVGNYKDTSKKFKREMDEKLNNLAKDEKASDYVLPSGSSKLNILEASVGLGALVTFIGLYLGIIFLISGAAILALKELSESTDNKERFDMIRKLGADEKMIHKALFRQIGIFFITPLLLAIIHSIFGIKFCMSILETLGHDKLLPSIIMTAGFLVIIYGGYFLITYLCSKNVIKSR